MSEMESITTQAERYVTTVSDQLNAIRKTQWDSLRVGAEWIGEALLNDRWFLPSEQVIQTISRGGVSPSWRVGAGSSYSG